MNIFLKGRNSCIKMKFLKVQRPKLTFQSSETKTEFHIKFRDKNNSLTYFLLQYSTFNIQGGLYWGYISQACLPPVQRGLIIFCALLLLRNVIITIPQNMD